MIHSFAVTAWLAWRYIAANRFKSILVVFCLTLTVVLPIALTFLLGHFNEQVLARANATPMVLGAKGSRVDLVLHSLYCRTPAPGTVTLNEAEKMQDLAQTIPIHSYFTAQRNPIVGTTFEYFQLRQLELAAGTPLSRLGDCVVGSRVAAKLGLVPGDRLLSDRDNLLDFAGRYPLKMRVTGILKPTRSADDDIVLVDLKTVWVLEGFGHGHQSLDQETDEGLVLSRDDDSLTASAAVLPYTEITDENVHSFHFHGGQSSFPVTAILVVPKNEKARALLLGRYQSERATAQLLIPTDVVTTLMALAFRVQAFFNANAILVGISTGLLMTLVILLSIRLRQHEMDTMYKIGCRRSMMCKLVVAELLILALTSAVAILVTTWLLSLYADEVILRLLA